MFTKQKVIELSLRNSVREEIHYALQAEMGENFTNRVRDVLKSEIRDMVHDELEYVKSKQRSIEQVQKDILHTLLSYDPKEKDDILLEELYQRQQELSAICSIQKEEISKIGKRMEQHEQWMKLGIRKEEKNSIEE